MARKKAAPAQEPRADDIFAHFERHGRSLNADPAPQDRAPATQSADLLARLDALEQNNAQLQDQLRRAHLAAPGGGGGGGGTAPPVPTKLDLTGLPNQIENPEEHARVLQERINAMVEGRDHVRRQEEAEAAARKQQSEGLWSGFAAAYPDWADHEDVVEVVSAKVAQKAKAAGMDMGKYFTTGRDIFFADVAKELNSRFGKLIDKEDAPAPREDDNATDGRTAGIFGGSEAGGKPTTDRGAPSSMMKDLQDVQRKMGLF